MAFIKPMRLTCPACDFTGAIKVVVGVGPHTRGGDIPYQTCHEAGPFLKEADSAGKPTGRLLCPHDETPVWQSDPGKRALGPLTRTEMNRPINRKWYAPGTAPKPKPRRYNPNDPFSPPPPSARRPVKPK